MKPRLENSNKSTSVPKELIEQVCDVFSENFSQHAASGSFLAQGRIYNKELLLSVGYKEEGRLKQNNFEVSIEYNSDKENVLKLIHLAVDALASMVENFFENQENHELPHDWQEFELGNKAVFLRYHTENTELEAEADRLLGEGSDELVQGEDDDEELKARITMLGLDDDSEIH